MSGYVQQSWVDGNLAYPPSAARFLYMEDGIYRAHPQVVTSLPTGATPWFDGQLIRVRVPGSTAALEAWWTFAHDGTNGTAQPWAFIGGSPLVAQVDASFSTASTVFVADGVNGPQVTVPFLGVYEVRYGATIANSSAAAAAYVAINFGGATAAADETGLNPEPVANSQIAIATSRAIIVTSNNQLIQLQYGVSAGTGTFLRRWLSVLPIRVGP